MGVLVLEICALTFLAHDPLIIRVGSIELAVKIVLDAEKKNFHFCDIDNLVRLFGRYIYDSHNSSISAC
jgi:hypothetical protein